MSLAQLVRQKKWSELEDAWTEHALGDAAIQPALEAVDVAASRKEVPRCLNLLREHASALLAHDRPGEAAQLLGHAMVAGGSPGELAPTLYEAAEKAYSSEPFWEAYVEISGFHASAPDMRTAWRSFTKLLALEEGRVVYHAKGWGLGEIKQLDHEEREAKVRFVSGRMDRFPFTTAVDIFEMLDHSDLRCLVVRDPDELTRLVKKDPLEVLRWVVAKSGGKALQASIKLSLGTLGVESTRYSAWWKKAQKEAETSEWFELSGPTNKRVVRMLDQASDPAEGIRRQLRRSRDLADALARVKALVAGDNAGAEVMEAALSELEDLVQESETPIHHRLTTWLFLRDRKGETPGVLHDELQAILAEAGPPGPGEPPVLWSVFGGVSGLRDQERCIELLTELQPDHWREDAAEHLPHAPPGMVRGLVEALEEKKDYDSLLRHYIALLARPTRNPALLVRLAERLEKGQFDEQLPPKLQRVQCLLQLAVHLNRATSVQVALNRAKTKLSALLVEGKKPLLPRLLDEADVETLRGFASMIEAGVDRAIDREFTRVAVAVSPDVFRGEEKPFWEAGGIWSTRKGIAAREEELRILRDVKIPENAEAIGRAASYGDLSENSEWEAAIEDQRNLTNRAMELELQLREALALEDAVIPGNIVSPGVRVTYRESDSAEEQVATVLGPWDADGERTVSYLSPLAAGMLGKGTGQLCELKLPGGSLTVEILRIEPLTL